MSLGIKTLLRWIGEVPTVDFVIPQIAIGGRARAWRLRRAGITHIINLRMNPDKIGITELHNPTRDDRAEKGPEYWAKSVDWATMVLTDPDTNLYVHCSAGKHRSSGTVYSILRELGYSPEEAWSKIQDARPKVRPVYVPQIERYRSLIS